MFQGVTLTAGGKKYFSELKKLKNHKVHVGFQGDSGSYDDGTTVAEVAAYNELGTSSIPARPFMRQSFENHQDKLQKACDKACADVANGGTAEDALNTLGVTCKGLIQQEIVSGNFAPNSPATISKKGSSQPLIDTGTMRQSVNYVIK